MNKHRKSMASALLAFMLCACGRIPSAGEGKSTAQAPSEETVTYEGIDVSSYQGSVDWAQVKGAGLVFAFAKATQGTSQVDPEFATNWSGMRAAGLVCGAYHFLDADQDPTAQAEHFLATVKLEAGDLPPVLDIEVTQGMAVEGLIQRFLFFLRFYRKNTFQLPSESGILVWMKIILN